MTAWVLVKNYVNAVAAILFDRHDETSVVAVVGGPMSD